MKGARYTHLHTYHFDKLMTDYQADELVPCTWSVYKKFRKFNTDIERNKPILVRLL